jgi:hypothetical protein
MRDDRTDDCLMLFSDPFPIQKCGSLHVPLTDEAFQVIESNQLRSVSDFQTLPSDRDLNSSLRGWRLFESMTVHGFYVL